MSSVQLPGWAHRAGLVLLSGQGAPCPARPRLPQTAAAAGQRLVRRGEADGDLHTWAARGRRRQAPAGSIHLLLLLL